MGIIQRFTQFLAGPATAPAAVSSPAPAPAPVKRPVLEEIREQHLHWIGEQRKIRRQIQELAWKPGSMPEVARLRSERDAEGRRKNGKKALRLYRRPETGGDRYDLWNRKRSGKYDARLYNVLYGMLRGRPYTKIEPVSDGPISSESLYNILRCYEPNLSHDVLVEIGKWVMGERASMRGVV